MQKLRILQIGDVHFSQDRLEASDVDLKDRQFPAPVASIATRRPLQSVVRQIVETVTKDPVDAYVMVGDLTDKGNLENYQLCLEYLSTSLGFSSFDPNGIHCVPGNHDIASRQILPTETRTEPEIWSKFDPLYQAWSSIGVPAIATGSIRTSTLQKGNAKVEMISLNSCVGCGEFRSLPKEILAAISELTSDSESYWNLSERLDTPCFSDNHLTEMAIKMGSSEGTITLVVAHHNLLPQSTPRISPYGELLNGGYVRTMLEKCKSPVIYCHGHIHKDPIEIIGSGCTQPPRLLTISAPELHDGFNVIEVYFTDQGIPLGVEIHKFRISETHPFSTTPQERLKLCFRRPCDYHKITDSLRSQVLQIVASAAGRFAHEILKTAQSSLQDLEENLFCDILEELSWHGIIVIQNNESQFNYWKITHVMSNI